jgi:single-strand DNA-binding protein
MAVTDIGLAVNRTWFDKQTNSRKEDVTFVDVTLWGRQAEVAGEYLAKGRSVLIEGRLQLDQWDDRETGQKRSKLKVVGENMTMLGGRGDAPRGGGSSQGGLDSGTPSQEPPGDYDTSYEGPSGEPPSDEVPF